MIITCTECSTNFNFDESLLKKEGSKVSCCVCDFVFTVTPDKEPAETSNNETRPTIESSSAISDPSISDPSISDPSISDPSISDPSISGPVVESDRFSLELGIDEIEEEGFFELEQEVIDENIEPISELTLMEEAEEEVLEEFTIDEFSEEYIDLEEVEYTPEEIPEIELEPEPDDPKPPVIEPIQKAEIKDHLPLDFEQVRLQLLTRN